MFDLTKVVIVTLQLTGLDQPPDADGFSVQMSNSYFLDAGVDVSLTWIGADKAEQIMAQSRENLAEPKLVTVKSIETTLLGAVETTEVVYWKSLAVVDPANPQTLTNGYEATWQYIWPVDQGRTFGLLTLWRAGLDQPEVLQAGFETSRQRWAAAPRCAGTVFELVSVREGETLSLVATCVTAPTVLWGTVDVPVFHDYGDWQFTVDLPEGGTVAGPAQMSVDLPAMDADDTQGEFAEVERLIGKWDAFLRNIGAHAEAAGGAFLDALVAEIDSADPKSALRLSEITMNDEGTLMTFAFYADQPNGSTWPGSVSMSGGGEVTKIEIY